MRVPLSASLKLGSVFAAGLVLTACAKKAEATKDSDFAGVYTLVSVNGKPIPASIEHDRVIVEVRSGSFTIGAAGTCSTRTTFVPPSGTEVTREVSATYTMDGARLRMQWKGAGQTVGVFQGNTFSMDNEGMEFIYRK